MYIGFSLRGGKDIAATPKQPQMVRFCQFRHPGRVAGVVSLSGGMGDDRKTARSASVETRKHRNQAKRAGSGAVIEMGESAMSTIHPCDGCRWSEISYRARFCRSSDVISRYREMHPDCQAQIVYISPAWRKCRGVYYQGVPDEP